MSSGEGEIDGISNARSTSCTASTKTVTLESVLCIR